MSHVDFLCILDHVKKGVIKQLRDYTVNNNLDLENGTVHKHDGKTYKRSYIGGAAFDHEIGQKFEDTEDGKMWKMYRTNRSRYYKKYHTV